MNFILIQSFTLTNNKAVSPKGAFHQGCVSSPISVIWSLFLLPALSQLERITIFGGDQVQEEMRPPATGRRTGQDSTWEYRHHMIGQHRSCGAWAVKAGSHVRRMRKHKHKQEKVRVNRLLGDFRVAFRLCFKASPSAKP